MCNHRTISSLLLVVAVVLSWTALAHSQRGRGNCLSNYDMTTETAITGTVQQVVHQTGKRGWNGTHLVIKTESETLPVHVGRSSYLAKQQFSFTAGDQVSILGSRVKMDGTDALIAREITKSEKTLVLRNAQGVPYWSAGRDR